MNRENLVSFKGEFVKLVLQGNFVLCGVVDDVYSDSILFSTKQKTAIIRFERIQEICKDNRRNDG